MVEVETYLRSEGVLVRFWYPIDMLERPPQGYRKASIIGNQVIDMSNIHIHRSVTSSATSVYTSQWQINWSEQGGGGALPKKNFGN